MDVQRKPAFTVYPRDTVERFLTEKLAGIMIRQNILNRGELLPFEFPFGYREFRGAGHYINKLTEPVLENIYQISESHHIGDERKDIFQSTYMIHLIGTVGIGVNLLGMNNPETVAAGFLHDVFENSIFHYLGLPNGGALTHDEARSIRRGKLKVTLPMIEELSGHLRADLETSLVGSGLDTCRVISLVTGVTKYENLSTEEYFRNILLLGDEGVLLKDADKTYNLVDLPFVSDRAFVWNYIRKSIFEFIGQKIHYRGGKTTFIAAMPADLQIIFRRTLFSAILENYDIDRQLKSEACISESELPSLLDRAEGNEG